MYASLLILLKFGPDVYSISNRYVCIICVCVCACQSAREWERCKEMRGVRVVSTRGYGCFVYAEFNTGPVVISGFIIQKCRQMEIERHVARSG